MENNDQMSVISNIINVNEETFLSEVVDTSKTKPVIVDFWAPWCEPCKTLTPLLEDAIRDHGKEIILAKVDIDQNQNIASQLRIQSIPTVYTFFEGKVVDGFQGAKTKSEIIDFVKKAANFSGPGQEVQDLILNAKEYFEQRDWNNLFDISQKILEKDPENHMGFGNLIRSMIGLYKFSEARQLIDTLAIEIKNSKPVKEAISLIDISEKAFMAKGSIEDLENKLKQEPDNLDYLLEMAIALFGIGKIEDSFEMLLKSIKIDKDWKEQAARKQLLEFFSSAGIEAKETINARKKLATLLFS
jgi:putative thioredoxin|tara:strand:- start:77 stop:979 length:903 start_codon:yes stop_codon:yes gene_type:complete